VVSNDGKKENYKEDIMYLWVDQTRKPAMAWETLLGCRCSHVKREEGYDGDENDAKATHES
jgi:hypothetical protein